MSKTDSEMKTVEWEYINWRKVEKYIFKLQKRIYAASRCGDVRRVRKLQRTMVSSWSNKVLAVRRVTQDNQGKKTAGVDGVKSLTPKARKELVGELELTGKSKPNRRVRIPKPGSEVGRPLGIPTMYDRALQAVVKNILEPEWEAVFEPNSYGFRPGRSAQDAIKQIKNSIVTKAKYVLDGDFEDFFGSVSHKPLLEKLGLRNKVGRQVKAWLKSGVIEMGSFVATTKGTPQGGVISPLLGNIALDGLERLLDQAFPANTMGYISGATRKYGRRDVAAPRIIRYADDFVILCDEKSVLEECVALMSGWLTDRGLKLNPKKTRLTHTFDEKLSEDGKAGFDFLSHHIQQYPAGKYRSTVNSKQTLLGFNTLIIPSKKSNKEHGEEIGKIISRHKSTPQEALIRYLNHLIGGWTRYFKNSDAKSEGVLCRHDHLTYLKLRRWAKRRCKSLKSGKQKYWRKIGGDNWVFAAVNGRSVPLRLLRHRDIECSSTDYVKVKGDKSPYDGDLVYWSTRMGKHPELSGRKAGLLRRQRGKCCQCGLYFRNGDVMEIDHKIATALGGRDEWKNLQLLHRHCHDVKTREDMKEIRERRAEKEMTGYLEKVLGKRTIVWRDKKPYVKGEVYMVINKLKLNWEKVEVEVVDGLVRIDGLKGRKLH